MLLGDHPVAGMDGWIGFDDQAGFGEVLVGLDDTGAPQDRTS